MLDERVKWRSFAKRIRRPVEGTSLVEVISGRDDWLLRDVAPSRPHTRNAERRCQSLRCLTVATDQAEWLYGCIRDLYNLHNADPHCSRTK